jgi:hypothetical protein
MTYACQLVFNRFSDCILKRTYLRAFRSRSPNILTHHVNRCLQLKNDYLFHLISSKEFILGPQTRIGPRRDSDPILPTPLLDQYRRRPRRLLLHNLDATDI